MSENPFAKYGMPQRNDSSNPFAKYGFPDQEREKIIDAYAKDIERRQQIYGGLPAEKLKDPATLYALAEREAEREGWKMPETQKQDRVSSFVLGYGQGGTFGFADELSGAVDFVGGTGAGLLRGEGLGAIESGKQAYSNRVEADRRLMRQARVDNPVTTIAGELTGGIVTTAPAPVGLVGGGARTTGQVALQTADKAAKLQQAAQAATGARQASLAAKSAALSAKAAKLSLPAQTLGQAASRFGGRLAESTGKGLGYGAAYGGIYGAGTAEGNIGERLDEAAFGAAIGGVAGGALTPAIQFIAAPIVSRIGYGILTSADNKALDIVLRRAERSGTSLQKVQSDFDAWAKTGEVPETLAELMGPNERSLLSALITVNRETREQATDVFVGRGRGEVNRLEDAFTKSFGASRKDYQATKAAAAQARAKEAEPFYEGAYIDATTGQRKFLGQPETDQLVYEIGGSRVAQSTLSTASDYADALGKRAIRDEIDDFAKAMKDGRPVRPLSVEAADYIERGINRRYGAATKGEAQDIPAGLRGLRDRVRTIIDPSGLGDARATAAEAIRRGELLEEGLDIMLPTVDVDDVTRVMGGIPDLGIPPASAEGRRAYGVGASRAIGLKLRETPDMRGFADATQKVARSPSLRDKLDAARPKDLVTDPAILNIQKKLDAGKKLTAKQQLRLDQFGKQFAEKQGSAQTRANAELDQAIERAAERAQFGVDMVGNSRTAFRQGDVEDALLDDAVATQVGQGLSDLIIGGPGMAGANLFNQFGRNAGRFLSQPSIYRPNINRAAANVLLATGEEIPKQIARLAARAANRNVTRITMRGMPPPAGGGTAASGFAPALRTDLGNAAGGALGGGIMPIPSTGDPQEDMRNRIGAVLGGAALGFGARRFVGAGGDDLASFGPGGKRPRKDSPEAILAGVQKITAQLKATGTQAATPQQPEMRIGRGLAKAAGITDNRELGAKAARDMLAAGRSPAEIFTATNHVPMTVDGNTIMVRAAGKSPDEVTAAFWQEMAKPVSRRAEWIREQTRSIKPIGPDAVARQPLETRAQVVTSMIRKGEPIKPQAIWEETDMVVIMRGRDGQPVISKYSVPDGSEPVSLMDGANFKSFDDVMEYLETVQKLPRAEQPAWYRENFSDPLTLDRPASRLQRAGDFAQRNQNTVGATLIGGAALGGTAGVLTAKDPPASMRIKLDEPPQRQNRR